jgi:hypothetical protein
VTPSFFAWLTLFSSISRLKRVGKTAGERLLESISLHMHGMRVKRNQRSRHYEIESGLSNPTTGRIQVPTRPATEFLKPALDY